MLARSARELEQTKEKLKTTSTEKIAAIEKNLSKAREEHNN